MFQIDITYFQSDIMESFKVILHNYMWIIKSKEDPYFKVSSIKSVAFCGVLGFQFLATPD